MRGANDEPLCARNHAGAPAPGHGGGVQLRRRFLRPDPCPSKVSLLTARSQGGVAEIRESAGWLSAIRKSAGRGNHHRLDGQLLQATGRLPKSPGTAELIALHEARVARASR